MENNNGNSGRFGKVRPRRPRFADAERTTEHSGEHRSSAEHRSYGDRPAGGRRSFGDRPQGERRSFGDCKPYGDRPHREDRPFGDRPRGGRRPFGDRLQGERRSFGDRKPFGDRPQREDRPFGDRPAGNRRSFGDRPQGERRSFGDRPAGGRRSFGDRPRGDRRPFGARKPFGRRPYGDRPYDEEAAEGMNEMLSRRPLIDDNDASDNDMVDIPVKDVVRLNKFMANSGICSRREADDYIQAGVVTVNGEVVTELGTKINVLTDDVRFNGERLRGEEKVYILMNKPRGFVTTASDPHADKTVMDLLKGCIARVFPVGRLDKNTTGVLMFTNDGEISDKLTHPSYDKKKIYQVSLDSDLSKEDYDKILAGVELADGPVAADDLQYVDDNDHRKLGIEIHSGKNRVVRRMFESLGYQVRFLDRVYFAGLTKKGLKRGEWRYLTEGEINLLKMGAYR